MILEYLFSDKKIKEEILKYNTGDIKVKKTDIKDSDYFFVKFTTDRENKQSASDLSIINEDMIKHPNCITLINEAAFFYNKNLYPLVNKFERKLRKLLYLASKLSNNSSDFDLIDNLENRDLGELFDILFTDIEFINNIKTEINNNRTWRYTKKDLIDALSSIPENTLWDKLPNSKIAQTFEENFILIKDYRNDVMHARNMDTKQFNDIKNIFTVVNKELDDTINDILDNRLVNSYIDNIQEFSDLLNESIKNMNTITFPSNQRLGEIAVELSSGLSPTQQRLGQIAVELSSGLSPTQQRLGQIAVELSSGLSPTQQRLGQIAVELSKTINSLGSKID